MDSASRRIEQLLHAYLNGLATAAERRELMEMIGDPIEEEKIKELIDQEMGAANQEDWETEHRLSNDSAERILSNILGSPAVQRATPGRKMAPVRDSPGRKWIWRAAAAALILVGGMGSYRIISRNRQIPAEVVRNVPLSDLPPGGNKAVLILANGSKIVLDSAQAGRLTRQGSSEIVKLDSGKIAYVAVSGNPRETLYGEALSGGALYNTLKTPRGGQFQLTLPDGTRVWLSAASSIKYPTAFTGNERNVEISGEAYFEVAKMKNMPFVVRSGEARTIVLGTNFNINAYEDENDIRITLLEGMVRVESGEKGQILRPGQQAVIDEATKSLHVRKADVYQAVAWKNGQFDFDNTDLPAIMRQISRWYDVDIDYLSMNDTTKFGGGISRQLTLSNVLRLLDKSGVHARLEGKKIIVLP